jgi:ABC-type antimicrobial peptide transport system permease subunit
MFLTGGLMAVAAAVVVAWFVATAYTEAEQQDWAAEHGEVSTAPERAEPFAVEYPLWFAGFCALVVAVVGSVIVLLSAIVARLR